jgi:hypothetical protein
LIRFELTGWNDFDLSSQDSIDEQNFGRHHIIQEYGGGLAGGAVDFTLRPVSSPVVLPSAARAVSSTMPPFFNFPPQVLEPAPQVGNYAPAVTSEPAWAAPSPFDLLVGGQRFGWDAPAAVPGHTPGTLNAAAAVPLQPARETKSQKKNRKRKENNEARRAGRGNSGAGT